MGDRGAQGGRRGWGETGSLLGAGHVSRVLGTEEAAVLTVLRHPKVTALFKPNTKKGPMPPSLGSGIKDPAPKLWGLYWWHLMTFTWALRGQGRAGKQQDMAHQEDLELAQKGHGAELSISPFEFRPLSPPHTLVQRGETKSSAGLCALSKVLEREINPSDEVEALSKKAIE